MALHLLHDLSILKGPCRYMTSTWDPSRFLLNHSGAPISIIYLEGTLRYSKLQGKQAKHVMSRVQG